MEAMVEPLLSVVVMTEPPEVLLPEVLLLPASPPEGEALPRVPLIPAKPATMLDGAEVVKVEPAVSVVVIMPAPTMASVADATADETASLMDEAASSVPDEAATVVVPLASVAVTVPLALESP